MTINFEFDPSKSANNKLKHGLDFVEAQALWQERRVEIRANIVSGEMRYAVFGTIRGIHHTVIITYRGSSVRIISARRASAQERAIYEQQIEKP